MAVTDGYDSADGQGGGIMVSLKNMVNETFALEAGRKIRAYHQMLDREGCFSGAHPPYGLNIECGTGGRTKQAGAKNPS